MSKIHLLEERHSVLNDLIADGEVVFQGKDLPDPEDPSDPVFTAHIYVSGSGAGTELICETGLIATGIPSIHVASWDKDSIKYLKHWLFKVLDDQKIYRANEIKIIAQGNWRLVFMK